MNINGNSANFFSYVLIKELFAPTLNRILASVKYVSFMMVVLNAKFARLLAVHSNKKAGENRRSLITVPCFASRNTLTFNFYRSLHSARKNESTYTFQRSMQANRNINLWQEKAPVQRLSRSKAPKTQQICHYRHTRKTSQLFFCCSTQAPTLVFTITLLTQVSVQKFPFLFISIIP